METLKNCKKANFNLWWKNRPPKILFPPPPSQSKIKYSYARVDKAELY